MASPAPVLSVVIPALDEEEAIGETVRRCLAARAALCERAGLAGVEVIVVSDGSHDRTEAIARGFDEVAVLAFEHNRGYGAAIRAGFAHASGELVGFLDADGTCNPEAFADLAIALEQSGADLAVGSRRGEGSAMPWLRALGNALFAFLLGVLSKRAAGDTASGMRVIRRAALPYLEPLPDGLHFTPAMTARVLLEDRLRLVEVPIPYAERVGRSKLSVLRDGFRFLRSIVNAAVIYRPSRPLLLLGGSFGLAALLAGLPPLLFWLANGRLEEAMIDRVLLALLFGSVTTELVAGAVVAEHMAATAHGRRPSRHGITGWLGRSFGRRTRRALTLLLLLVAAGLVASGARELLFGEPVTLHWSRIALASLLVVVAATSGLATFLLDMLELIEAERTGVRAAPVPDRVRPAPALTPPPEQRSAEGG